MGEGMQMELSVTGPYGALAYPIAFSSNAGTALREENASKQCFMQVTSYVPPYGLLHCDKTPQFDCRQIPKPIQKMKRQTFDVC